MTRNPALLVGEVMRLIFALDDATAEIARLRAEVERLRLIPAATKEELDAMESLCDTESTCDVHMLVTAAKTRAEIVRGFIERHRT